MDKVPVLKRIVELLKEVVHDPIRSSRWVARDACEYVCCVPAGLRQREWHLTGGMSVFYDVGASVVRLCVCACVWLCVFVAVCVYVCM